jgi:hypothetical protein
MRSSRLPGIAPHRSALTGPCIVPKPTDPALDEQAADTFVTVARSLDPWNLQILRARLAADGVAAYVADENINCMNSLWAVAVGGTRLQVAQRDAEAARRIVALLESGAFALGDDDVLC